jgi:hypothetical protein
VVRACKTTRSLALEGEGPEIPPEATVLLLAEAEGEVLCAGPGPRLFKVPADRVPEIFRAVELSADEGFDATGLGSLITLLLVGGGALCKAEAEGGGSIRSLEDALWYGINTVSTVGVGDVAPTTPAGKLVASALMALGNPLYAKIGRKLLGQA